ncbi:MAG: ABC transporter permease [Spirochaetia bacterium]|jgi:ribose/xylose/arabinose/galactoside ABC-type transport system permease subunit
MRFEFKDILSTYGILIVLIALCVVFAAMTSGQFFALENVFNILKQVAVVGIMSVGMTMVLLTGGIDLSIGSIAGVGCVLAAALLLKGISVWGVALAVLAIATLIGMLNGFFINELKIPPLITTLAMMTSVRGVAYLITGGMPIFGFKSDILVIGQGYVGFIPVPVIVMVIIFLIGIVFVQNTRYGRYIYGVGGNEEASRLSGISVKRIKYVVYSISGLLSGLAGMVMLARINSGTPKMGQGYEMDVITAVVLGGVSISGGEGRLGFVIVGVLIMGVLTNGLILLNVQEYVQWVIKGMALIAAVGFDRFIQQRKIKAVAV